MVADGDAVLALSASGETEELLRILPAIARFQVKIIAICGDADSTLAKNAHVFLDVNIEQEACPLNLAPTSSTTVMLALGDALAMVLLEARGFNKEDFAKFHPAGVIGRSLLMRVHQIMRPRQSMAIVSTDTTIRDVLKAMTSVRAALNSQLFLMAAANDLRKGMAIKYNGNPAIVLEVHHRTPGNLRAFVQAIIRYINTGKSADVRFGSTDKVELVEIERKNLEFSYKDRNGFHFMDPETYDTITLQENLIGGAKDYLVENLSLQVLYAEGKPVQVELPASVSLKVVESPEGVRGDTASNVTKPALLETGKTINVPLFIKEGENIKIDTRSGAYMGRA